MIDKQPKHPTDKTKANHSSHEIHMVSLDTETTTVKDFNAAIQTYLEKCPPETDWFTKGSKLYAITTDNTLDLASQFRKLNETINSWPRTADIKLEQLIARLSADISNFYDKQPKPQSEPSTPERKLSSGSDSDGSDALSAGSSLSGSPKDTSSVSPEPAAKQEIIDCKAAIAKFKKACLEHSPTWLPKALDLYNILSNDLIDDANKFDQLLKQIEAWGKVNNANLAVAINQLELDLKAYYEMKREATPCLQRTGSLGSDLSESSTQSAGSSSSSPSKSPALGRKPRKTRIIDLDGNNNGKTKNAPKKTNPVPTTNPSVKSSAVASPSPETQSDIPAAAQARPGTPITFTDELPFAPITTQEESAEQVINDTVKNAASPTLDSPLSTSLRSSTSSIPTSNPLVSPSASPTVQRKDSPEIPPTAVIVAVENFDSSLQPRSTTPELQTLSSSPIVATPEEVISPLSSAPSSAAVTPERPASPSPATVSIVESAQDRAPHQSTTAQAVLYSQAPAVTKSKEIVSQAPKPTKEGLEKELKQLIENKTTLTENIKNEKETREYLRRALGEKIVEMKGNVSKLIKEHENAFGSRSASRFWDYIPFIHYIIPSVKRAYDQRQAALNVKFEAHCNSNKNAYEAKTLLHSIETELQKQSSFNEKTLADLKRLSDPSTKIGLLEIMPLQNKVNDYLSKDRLINLYSNRLSKLDTDIINKQRELSKLNSNLSADLSSSSIQHSMATI